MEKDKLLLFIKNSLITFKKAHPLNFTGEIDKYDILKKAIKDTDKFVKYITFHSVVPKRFLSYFSTKEQFIITLCSPMERVGLADHTKELLYALQKDFTTIFEEVFKDDIHKTLTPSMSEILTQYKGSMSNEILYNKIASEFAEIDKRLALINNDAHFNASLNNLSSQLYEDLAFIALSIEEYKTERRMMNKVTFDTGDDKLDAQLHINNTKHKMNLDNIIVSLTNSKIKLMNDFVAVINNANKTSQDNLKNTLNNIKIIVEANKNLIETHNAKNKLSMTFNTKF